MATVIGAMQPAKRKRGVSPEPRVGPSFGFTGTSHDPGMTPEQAAAVKAFLREHRPCTLRLGDCIYADAQAFRLCQVVGRVWKVGHPPDDPKKRAFCEPYNELWPEKPYLQRNDDIVLQGVDGLLATPLGYEMPRNLRGQGTWSTIRKAVKLGRPLFVFLPDGSRWE